MSVAVFERLAVRSGKMHKKPRIIIASTPKTSFFAIENGGMAQDIPPPQVGFDSMAMAGQPQGVWQRTHYVGSPPRDGQARG